MRQFISNTITFVFVLLCLSNHAEAKGRNVVSSQQPVSFIDTSLEGSQKYVARVDGQPFYMLSIQIRVDVMRYAMKVPSAAIEQTFQQAANDGFNTVGIPIHWAEVEQQQDCFDWTILDQYLTFATRYGLKMEMLWFGTNSGGYTQWLAPQWQVEENGTDSITGNSLVHLRVPDYVLHAESFGSADGKGFQATTSRYHIAREMSNYTLDLNDSELCRRETYVLSQVMQHIAQWDKAQGSPHTLIGVQIGNEVGGYRYPFHNDVVVRYLSQVASAVKQSPYNVWTRINCVPWSDRPRIQANESLRVTTGTCIDFCGLDTYRHHFCDDADYLMSLRTAIPYCGRNYRMIMETNGGYHPAVPMAAIAGNNALSYYDFFGLYTFDKGGDKLKKVCSEEILTDVRLTNRILASDNADIALKAHGYGLYVHNWQGCEMTDDASPQCINFKPAYTTSFGISINHADGQYILMTTRGGVFELPASLSVKTVSLGKFSSTGQWLTTQTLSPANKIRLEAGQTVLVNCVCDTIKKQQTIRQAEEAILTGGMTQNYNVENYGFAGNGYLELPTREGATAEWNHINGQNGGSHTILLRYSLPGNKSMSHMLYVNGYPYVVKLQPTGSGHTYQFVSLNVELSKGTENVIRLESRSNFYGPDKLEIKQNAGIIDEIIIE